MSNIADPLREFVRRKSPRADGEFTHVAIIRGENIDNLMSIADQIDREHERQMAERGSAHKVTHGTDEYGHTTCSACGVTVHRRDKWCWSCGAKLGGEVEVRK